MTWKFENPRAILECDKLAGEVNVASPQCGIRNLRLESAPLAGHICSVERDELRETSAAWPAKIADAYVRGDDLVASYEASEAWPFAPQVYWRAGTLPSACGALSSVSLEVSVSTPLLDTHPRIAAVTQLAADEMLHVTQSDDDGIQTTIIAARKNSVLRPRSDPCCLLWRMPGGRLSYAEIVPATDFRELTLHFGNDGACRARWELIAEFMEKGVIRRTRLDAIFLPRERDVELAADCCRQFSSRPLPLTT